ncbi:MAG: DUF4367 domain-containing protein [Firmicutes bacterium]|nr:DUF4367 domain-containing protein [Bacillota bacterium]
MWKRVLACLILLSIFFGGCAVTAEKITAQLEKKLQKLESFYAQAVVKVYSPAGEQNYHVNQWYKAPDRWRVEVTAAEERQYFICNGEQIWIYQPDLNDYYRLDAERGEGEIAPPFMLTKYLQQLCQSSSQTFGGEEELNGRKTYCLTYAGRLPEESVKLYLDKKTLFPKLVEIYLNDKIINHITIHKLEINPELQDDLFEYTEAAGSEVSAQCIREPLTLAEVKADWTLPLFVPTYLPPQSSLYTISHTSEYGSERLIFVYQGLKKFTLIQQAKKNDSVYRSRTAREVPIGSGSGLFQENSDGSLNTLWWSKEECSFILTGELPLTEMVKIATSLEPEGV